MVPEARIESTEHGLVPSGKGWFVLNARDAPWRHEPGRRVCDFEGDLGILAARDQHQRARAGRADGDVPLGSRQEDFLVLAGEALLIVEGKERPLRQWDFVHCPAGTKHMIVGAGEGLRRPRRRRPRRVDRPGLGRLHSGRDRTPPRRRRRGGDERAERGLRAIHQAEADAVSSTAGCPLAEGRQVLLQAAALRERLEGAGVGHIGVGDVRKGRGDPCGGLERGDVPSWLTAKSERIELPELARSWRSPESHLEFIRNRLGATDGLNILSVGYSGLDSGLLQLLASSGNSIRSLFAVNHEGVSALEAATRISTAFSDVAHPDMAYAGTFESFAQSGGLEEYLTTLA